jgi:excisionase family DNA binding protein
MITDSQAPRWLTMAQYAKAMGLSLSSVKRMKLTGAIPFRQVGRIVRIPTEATDWAWLKRWRTRTPRPE